MENLIPLTTQLELLNPGVVRLPYPEQCLGTRAAHTQKCHFLQQHHKLQTIAQDEWQDNYSGRADLWPQNGQHKQPWVAQLRPYEHRARQDVFSECCSGQERACTGNTTNSSCEQLPLSITSCSVRSGKGLDVDDRYKYRFFFQEQMSWSSSLLQPFTQQWATTGKWKAKVLPPKVDLGFQCHRAWSEAQYETSISTLNWQQWSGRLTIPTHFHSWKQSQYVWKAFSNFIYNCHSDKNVVWKKC